MVEVGFFSLFLSFILFDDKIAHPISTCAIILVGDLSRASLQSSALLTQLKASKYNISFHYCKLAIHSQSNDHCQQQISAIQLQQMRENMLYYFNFNEERAFDERERERARSKGIRGE
eukprot:TRINITY_DN2481_c0_g2_i2.p4 TRINITY_DN2481_c0_g2~~TRINITY_DN2481_c0_g2_i2.p4  ORF type:complete len:118 (+),score=12.61 TRINITY_DN2481_c0_g2_i2:172-525(+)